MDTGHNIDKPPETLCLVKEARHKRTHIVWLYLYDISRKDKKLDWKQVGVCLELGWEGKVSGAAEPFWGDAQVPKVERGEDS